MAALTIAPNSSSGCPCTSVNGTWLVGSGAAMAVRALTAVCAVSECCTASMSSASCTASTVSRHTSCARFSIAKKTLVG